VANTNVAYLTPLYFSERSCLGGGERYPLNLARGLVRAARGRCQVRLISFGDSARREVLEPGLTLQILDVQPPPAQPLDVASWHVPAAIADSDIVHIHQAFTRSSEVALLAARQQQKLTCITDHGGHSSTVGAQVGSIELADRVICYSNFGASLFHTQVPIEVIKGGVDETFFTPGPGRPRREHVLFVGRLLPHKGVDRLIEALPAGLPLVVCGRKYNEDYFKRLLMLADGKRVDFVTDADDETVRDLYRRALVTVLPSVYTDCYGNCYVAPELMGFTLLESMACGTPALCARVGAMPEFVDHGLTGFVFDRSDELTGYLELLAANLRLAEEMGAQARRAVLERFGLRVVALKTLTVYDSLVGRRYEEAA
jgi:glycosyltransferase involved in cell wall biosynthesis